MSRAPLHGEQRGTHVELEADHGRHGVAGHAEDEGPPRTPKASGLPGLSRTPQKRRSTPSSSCTCLTKSNSPTETPPLVMTTSCSSARRRAARVSSRSSRATPSMTGSAAGRQDLAVGGEGVRVADLAGAHRLARAARARCRWRGWRRAAGGSPAPGPRRPTRAGRSPPGRGVRRAEDDVAAATSSPAGRTLAPGPPPQDVTVSPSWRGELDRHDGVDAGRSGAPVMIFAASPGPTGFAT